MDQIAKMVRDRLADIKTSQNSKSSEFDGPTSIEMADLGIDHNSTSKSGLDEFCIEVEQIKNCIDKLNHEVDEVKQIHSIILSAPQTEDSVKKRLESLMADIQSNANDIKIKLKKMEQDANKVGKENCYSAEHRIRTTQYGMLYRRFKEVIDDYQCTQADHRDRCKGRIKRQLEITGATKSDDEIEDMIESGNPAIFNSEIIMETQQAKQSLAEIQARHSDIMKLEKSITELRDLFVEIATQIEAQGEMVNRIENHVAASKAHVDKGGAEVNQAIAYRSRARLKKLICLTILVVLVAAIIFTSFSV